VTRALPQRRPSECKACEQQEWLDRLSAEETDAAMFGSYAWPHTCEVNDGL